MNAPDLGGIRKRFRERFGTSPRLFQAPGRINVIGEHTDYAGGLVMPAAIDRRCLVAAAPNGTRKINIVACDLGREGSADLASLGRSGTWIDYILGVAAVLQGEGVVVEGVDLMIESRVPVGAGVSSSAALEVAVAYALLALAGRAADGVEIARWAQRAENDFVGMPCGIMDQFASANGVADHALVLDCSTLRAEAVPLPPQIAFLIVDSMVRHAHVDGEYRARRADCETAAATLGVPALGVLDEADLPSALSRLPSRAARRCRHVVSENARVRSAAAALRAGHTAELGRLLNASHASLRDDMEVSVPEVDSLAAIAQATEGVFGARLMGGGFGGAVIALASAWRAADALEMIRSAYARECGRTPDCFICRAVGGAGEIAA